MPGQQGVVAHELIEHRWIQQAHRRATAIETAGAMPFRQNEPILIGPGIAAIHHRHIQGADDVDLRQIGAGMTLACLMVHGHHISARLACRVFNRLKVHRHLCINALIIVIASKLIR